MPISIRRCDRCPPSTGTSKGGVSRTRSPQLLPREPRPRIFPLLGPPLRVARPAKDLQRSVRISAMRERDYVIGGEILGAPALRAPRLSPHRRPRPLLVSRAVSPLAGRALRLPTSAAALPLIAAEAVAALPARAPRHLIGLPTHRAQPAGHQRHPTSARTRRRRRRGGRRISPPEWR